jgi:nucleotide-binding universal stress UspA family protein
MRLAALARMEHLWVVGLDLNEHSGGALVVADWLARPADSVAGVHVLESWARPHLRPDTISAVHETVLRATHALHLRPLASVSVREAIRAEDGLCAAAEHAAGIVIGRAAASSRPAMIRLGVVARQLLRQLPRPVIVAPPDLTAIAPGPVLLATDLGPSGDRAVAFARELASARGRPLAVLHVAESRYHHLIDEQGPAWVAAREVYHAETAAALADWAAAHGLAQAPQHLAYGDPPTRIAAVAAELQAAIVVVGSRHLGLLARAFLSSTASTLAGVAAAPVAVVPNA